MPVTDIIHVNIKTLDLEATDRFYTEVLGMTFANRPELGVPGSWYDFKGTQVHVLAGDAALDPDGGFTAGGGAVDHIALGAHDYDEMKKIVLAHGCNFRENNLPNADLWQLFVKDPNEVTYELNFVISQEPEGAVGPDPANAYIPGKF